MSDQLYLGLMQHIVCDDPREMAAALTLVRNECDRRTFEYWSGKRSKQSIHDRKYLACCKKVYALIPTMKNTKEGFICVG